MLDIAGFDSAGVLDIVGFDLALNPLLEVMGCTKVSSAIKFLKLRG